MKHFFLSLLFLSLIPVSCHYYPEYEVKGRVVGFGDDGKTVLIEHEDIPRLMPSMVMPFKALTAAEVTPLKVGDAVRFNFIMTMDSSWIHSIQVIPDTLLDLPPDSLLFNATEAAMPYLTPGDTLPSIQLLDDQGMLFPLDRYFDRYIAINFIYTSCPIPDFCPLLSRNFQALGPEAQSRLGENILLLSISFDPENDTPEVLNKYAGRYRDGSFPWIFATSTEEEIGIITAAFGINRFYSGADIEHNLVTALIGPGGVVLDIWRGNRWSAEDILLSLDTFATGES